MPPPRSDLEKELAAVANAVQHLKKSPVSPQQQKALLTAQSQFLKLSGRMVRSNIPYKPSSREYQLIALEAGRLGDTSTSSVLDMADKVLVSCLGNNLTHLSYASLVSHKEEWSRELSSHCAQ
ncbi:hypothetical protein [Pseudomonas xanthosomatis]|uniref:hypothetical protein n=1 Tax=Pseudomonas xanthosomatis TaxID=2842356 RepID=UPI001CEC817B|nr:hypothetical protein [Pseudomonas xanthosomatis]